MLHGGAGIVCNFAASIVICLWKIARRGYGVLRGTVTQIVGHIRICGIILILLCHSILDGRNAIFKIRGRSLGRLLPTGSQHYACKHGNQNCCDWSFTHYSPRAAAQSRTVLLDAPEEKR